MNRRERRLDERRAEIEEHLRLEAAELMERGLPAHEAWAEARRRFGNVTRVEEEIYEMTGTAWLDGMWRDVRYAARTLRRGPGFAAAVVATLALSIGANTAIFSVVDAVLLRPLPLAEPERLAQVARHYPDAGEDSSDSGQDGTTWEALRDGAKLARVAVYSDMVTGVNLALEGEQRAEFVQQQRVGATYFDVLGMKPAFGRAFLPEEDREGGPKAVILSAALCRRLFACGPAVLGRSLQLRGEPHVVVGMMPAEFRGAERVDLWTPLMASTKGEGQGENFGIVARLAPGAGWRQAEEQLAAVYAAMPRPKERPGHATRLVLVPLQKSLMSGYREPLLLLWGAVGVVLLIACVNIAGLMLARGRTRAHELATRVALGCGRAGVARQLLVESALLGVAGAVAGLGVGALALRGLLKIGGDLLPLWNEIGLDARVLAVTALAGLACSLLAGVAPAFSFSRVDVRSALVDSGSRGHAGSSRHWAQRAFLLSQVALGVMLLVSAGLLLRTLGHLRGLEPGFLPERLLTSRMSLQDARYEDPARIRRLYERGLEQLRQEPSVESAGLILGLPYERVLNMGFHRMDGPNLNDGRNEITNLCYVTPGLLETLQVRLKQGRLLTTRDSAGAAPVLVVNEAFAATYLKGQEAVGSHIRLGGQTVFEIVGVTGNVQQRPGWGSFGPLAAMPLAYVTAAQMPEKAFSVIHTWFSPNWVVRMRLGAAAGEAERVQRRLAALDPLLPVGAMKPLVEKRDDALLVQRFQALMLGGLAALALLLAAVGLYGMVATGVGERLRELGIRMALGAPRGRLVGQVLRPVLLLTVAGVGCGFALAMLARKLLASQLWGVTATDPATYAGVAAVLAGTAALAALRPALRVVRLDPAQTLRQD